MNTSQQKFWIMNFFKENNKEMKWKQILNRKA